MKKLLVGMGVIFALVVAIKLVWEPKSPVIESIKYQADVEQQSDIEQTDKLLLINKPLITQNSDDSNGLTKRNKDKQKNIIKKEPVTSSEEIIVEQAFLVNGKGVSLDFVRNIDDNDIFSTAISSLQEESANNIVAQENKNYYKNLALNIANTHLANNDNYDFELNDIQCGEKTCLFSATSSNGDMWEHFRDDLITAENGVYTSSHSSYVDDYGNLHYNSFISIDESVNSIVSTDLINTITLPNGTTINYDEGGDGG